jgi:hypothetical protein
VANRLTEFGATVLALSAEKGLRNQSEVVERLQNRGYSVSQQRLSNWIYGKNAAARDFPENFAAAMDLDPKQMLRLAESFTYGQLRIVRSDSNGGANSLEGRQAAG